MRRSALLVLSRATVTSSTPDSVASFKSSLLLRRGGKVPWSRTYESTETSRETSIASMVSQSWTRDPEALAATGILPRLISTYSMLPQMEAV